jgi:predicted MFS family arabinose efflux permease
LVTDLLDWRAAFAANALLTLAVAIAVAFMLPRERHFVRSEGLLASSRQILTHLRNPRLLAIYAVGFGVLFNFTSVFTYVNFHLAAALFVFVNAAWRHFRHLSRRQPAGAWIGRGVALFGRPQLRARHHCVWVVGALLLLAPPVGIIIAGLATCAACGLLCQATSTSYVITIAKEGRSSAVGLYASIFYIGGSAGASSPDSPGTPPAGPAAS